MSVLSVITISYNNLSGLKKTVESVISQSKFANIEYIIIDGGSLDGTKQYLSGLSNENIKWISESDRGISHAFNKGIELATGTAILCLNSGDTFDNTQVVENMLNDWDDKKVDILSYKVQVHSNCFIPASDNVIEIWNSCDMPHQGTLVAKWIYDEIGGYSEEYKIRMDYHFFARCSCKGYKFEYIPRVVVQYEPGGVSMKKENRIRFWKEGMAVKFMYRRAFDIKDFIKLFFYANDKD